MSKPKLETFGLTAIQTVLTNSDIQTARQSLAFAIGATVGASGIVQKVVKRNDQYKLVIQPDNVQLTVFADCLKDAKTVTNSKIRKGSSVRVKGKLQTFGASAVCLSGCRLR
jgi:hypothetical protein